METAKLKKFSQAARRDLIQQVAGKLGQVLEEGSLARREQARAVKTLEKEIGTHGRGEVIERVAYTWFNRLCALRFMDARGYNTIRVVSPAEGQSQPEILAEAKSGHIDARTVPENVQDRVFALLEKRSPSGDPQGEAYRLLLVAVCNHWHRTMPFMFEPIADYTELLMPDDLLSDHSVRTKMRTVMTEEDCQDVEIIGWLYQFYISEKKEDVFASLKKGKKVTPENIPAATQLFTPHWIVRYLIENSLGRLWLLNRPGSKLAEQMDYYIAPEEPDAEFLKISKPEEIKVCDPACGSGHMLTYAFDLLYTIYEEDGYDPAQIPALILQYNLTGVEIDDRAGALAAFALAMKVAARVGRRRFMRMETKPNILVLENVTFTPAEMDDVTVEVGRDLFTNELRETLLQFEQAKNFGSLIVPKLRDPAETLRVVEARDFGADLLLKEVRERIVSVLRMAEALSPKYHVVVANPPYMGGKGINPSVAAFLKEEYEDVRSDLFAAFIVRNTQLAVPNAQLGFMTPFVWMFISSYEKLRLFLLDRKTITSLIQLEYSGFDGATVPVCTFTVENSHRPHFKGGFVRLSDFRGAPNQGPKTLEAIKNPECGWFFRASSNDFEKVPGYPIAYWISDTERSLYDGGHLLSKIAMPRKGIDTGENAKFLRLWFEVEKNKKIAFGGTKWYPYNKGGGFRRWYGNREWVVNWENDGREIKSRLDWESKKPTIRNEKFFCREGFAWTTISSGGFSARYTPPDSLFDNGGCTLFADQGLMNIGSFLNSRVMSRYLEFLSPTLNFQPGDIGTALYLPQCASLSTPTKRAVFLAKSDWDAYETSWDFTMLPLLSPDHRAGTLEATYARLRTYWQGMTDEMQQLEEENNRTFIHAYGLQDELPPEVPMEEITLTCNPAYRYGVKGSEEQRENRLRAETMAEFLSYAVGCMFGRYSLDKPGPILANQSEMLEDYLDQVPKPTFIPDDDNVIPILDTDWFTDDIVVRFREFLKVTFGEDCFQENLEFIENAIGKPIRKYFLKDFYNDHVKRYKKRPIYWLFSSPKGSFKALTYMHRYRPDTVSVILNDYLREFRTKLDARIAHLEEIENSGNASAREKTAAMKEGKKLRDTVAELEDWERKVLLPLASEQIEIDLDEGVKANYPRFGQALAGIQGLSK